MDEPHDSISNQRVESCAEEKANLQSKTWRIIKWGCLVPMTLIVLFPLLLLSGGILGVLTLAYALYTYALPIIVVLLICFFLVRWSTSNRRVSLGFVMGILFLTAILVVLIYLISNGVSLYDLQ